jgi:hypothetical protein
MQVRYIFGAALAAVSLVMPLGAAPAPSALAPSAPAPYDYSHLPVPPLSSAASCTVAMAQLLNVSLGDEAQQKIRASAPEISLAEAKTMMADAGVKVEERRASLDALVESGAPAVLLLRNPHQFVVLLDSVRGDDGKTWLRLLQDDAKNLRVVARDEIESRYTGEALAPQLQKTAGASRLQTDSLDYHFVLRAIGVPVQYEYTLTNTGASDVEVQFMENYCGCSGTVKFSMDAGMSTVLKPGQSVPIKAIYTPQMPGSVSKTAVLKTSDPQRPWVYLTFRGEPSHKTQSSTQKIHFETKKGHSAEQSFEVSGPAMLMLGQPMLDNDRFSATATRSFSDNDKAIWQVTVKLSDKVLPGNYKATVAIPTNDPDNGTITIPLSAVVK